MYANEIRLEDYSLVKRMQKALADKKYTE